jgi:RIO kinase 2
MVRFDVSRLRYLSKDDFRVLVAVEMGMKNHEVVPTPLILRIANLPKTNGHLIIATLAKYGLIRHENKHFDGYKLTYQGYDFLAIKSLVKKGLIKGVGQRIGVGKESDVFEVLGQNDEVMILKIHRLGRICFRAVKQKRDYLGKRKNASFMYMSRLAAVREFAYFKALYRHQSRMKLTDIVF